MQAICGGPPVCWEVRYPEADADALDLLRQLLIFDPRARLTPIAALEHPFLQPLHELNTEPGAPLFDFSFEVPRSGGR